MKPAVLQVDKQQANTTACVSAVPTPELREKVKSNFAHFLAALFNLSVNYW